ncbi:conjugative transfer ATPase [Cysteiniphilum marinum]|uniref:conjugative transfer ATPase n=1 Tax=Cysteiniphilum marinum TaxID=2774191 RepID=UPI00193B2C7D|nr:conjugative transfer ATPase [Cysteiniphilum marinum]
MFNRFERITPYFKGFGAFCKDLVDFRGAESIKAGEDTFRLPPSFTKMMRLKEYDADSGLFYRDDNKTPVAMYEIKGIPTEGMSEERMQEIEQKVFQILNTFKKYRKQDYPWVVQMYCKDEYDLSGLYYHVKDSIPKHLLKTQLTAAFLKMFKSHCDFMCRDGGIFQDDATMQQYSGKRRVTRLVFYRYHPDLSKDKLTEETLRMCKKIETALKSNKSEDMTYKRIDDKAYFTWMFNKFHLVKKGYKTPIDYLKAHPFIEDEQDRVYGYDITEEAISEPVRSNKDKKYWTVGGTYHQYISCIGLKSAPEVGAVTAERFISGAQQAWFDRLPKGSEFCMTIMPLSAKDIVNDMKHKKKQAEKQTSLDAQKMLAEIDHFEKEIADNNLLFPTQIGCFVAGASESELRDNADDVITALGSLQLEVLDEEYDINQLDKWVRFLPANYQHSHDQNYYTAKLTSFRHIARLAPIGYGRISGSNNPLIINFNRNGEPVMYSPLKDRAYNQHKLVLGSTGTGKSVSAGAEIFNLMAIYRPYLAIIDAGKSFEFLVDFMEYLGCKVNRIVIEMCDDQMPKVSLNPFSDTQKAVDQIESMERLGERVKAHLDKAQVEYIISDATERVNKLIEDSGSLRGMSPKYNPNADLSQDDGANDSQRDVGNTGNASYSGNAEKEEKLEAVEKEEKVQRDYLSDFLLAALIIAGDGKDPDEVGFDASYKHELLKVIIETAKKVVADQNNPFKQMRPSDIKDGLLAKAKELADSDNSYHQKRSEKLHRLYEGFDKFLSVPLNQLYFDAYSTPIENPDITYFEMGIWKDDKESNIAPRSLAFITLMNKVMAECEAKQKQGRPYVLIGDECHIVTTKKATAASVTQCAKMSRKIGLVIWFYTQNAKDFPDSAAKMMSAFETWQILALPDDELEHISRFVNLTDHDIRMVKSIINQKRTYSELMTISPKYRFLSRCIPMREIIALMFNEIEEKTKRAEVAQQYDCTEAEAALIQAQLMRGESADLYRVKQILGIKGAV